MRADEEMIRPRRAVAMVAALAAALCTVSGGPVVGAEPQPDPGEIHGLKLGLKAAEMSADTFGDRVAGARDLLVLQHPDEDAVGDGARQIRLSRELHRRRERRRGEQRRHRRDRRRGD
jgi:hypothetical protein